MPQGVYIFKKELNTVKLYDSKVSLKTKMPLRKWSAILDITPECIGHYIQKGRLKAEFDPDIRRKTYYVSIRDMADFMNIFPIAFRYYQQAVTTERYSDILAVMTEYFKSHPRVRTMWDVANELGVTRNCVGQWVKKGYLDLDVPPFLISQKAYDALFERYPKASKYKAMKEAEDQAMQNYTNYLKRKGIVR